MCTPGLTEDSTKEVTRKTSGMDLACMYGEVTDARTFFNLRLILLKAIDTFVRACIVVFILVCLVDRWQ